MAAELQTDAGKAAYRRRTWIAQPPNGWIKSVLGFRQFSLHGLHRVHGHGAAAVGQPSGASQNSAAPSLERAPEQRRLFPL